jgi:hypothetical protein
VTTTTAVKERPILFSAPMVRAILSGRKTQTRRIVMPQPPEGFHGPEMGPNGLWAFVRVRKHNEWHDVKCPYGEPGDRLWVRETFYADHGDYADGGRLPAERPDWADDMLYYPADARGDGSWCCGLIPECSCAEVGKPKARPSIHMPRWASRLTLEVTGVLVERLQDISEADAIAEGIEERDGELQGSRAFYLYDHRCHWTRSPVESYQTLWESINGKGAWAANPWVWAITFKRAEAES